MSRSLGRRYSLATLAAALVAGSATLGTAPSPAADPQPVRVLVVGDSVTQGSSGDWTWRYRLDQHLRHNGAVVDLVGPRDDLFDQPSSAFGNQDYAAPDFDRDHAARWGMTLAAQDVPIGDLVRDYRPDVVVEVLGVNDFVYLDATPASIDDQLRTFVAEARGADPDVDVVLSQLPQRWVRNVAAYDDQLVGFAAGLDTSTSRVVPALMGAGFEQYVDTYDYAHPSSHGEVKIAAGVADALADLGIGPAYPRPLVLPRLGPSVPAALSVAAREGGADLSWAPPPGATAEYVWIRDLTADESWSRLPDPVEGRSSSVTGLTNGHTYAFRLQATKGTAIADELYSPVVQVVPRVVPPQAVTGLGVSRPADHRLAATWGAVATADAYDVRWCRTDTGTCQYLRVTTTSTILDRLVAGAGYTVTVRAVRDGVLGGPATAGATVTGPRPGPLAVTSIASSTTHRVTVRWSVAKDATRYQVLLREDGRGSYRSVGWTTARSFTTAALRPGHVANAVVRPWHQLMAGPSTYASVRVR